MTEVGQGTRISGFAHVLPRARIGRDCNICDGVFIENDVIVGDATTIKNGVKLWDGLRLGNRVFIGFNVTFTNDSFPRSKQHTKTFTQTTVEDDASIGANATILSGIRIGYRAVVRPGTVVTQDVPDCAVIAGNPGRVVGYAGAIKISADGSDGLLPRDTAVRLITLQSFTDQRGRLSVVNNLPFTAQRFFVVDNVPSGEARGGHALRSGLQFMIVVAGRMVIAVDDGKQTFAITFLNSQVAMFVPPLVWSMQYGHSPDAKLLVLCSEPYDRTDYISSYKEFSDAIRQVGT